VTDERLFDCVSGSYDPYPVEPYTLASFQAMCVDAFGEAPELTPTSDGGFADADGPVLVVARSLFRQCSGDVNPITYGGTFWRPSGDHGVEIVRLQPVSVYVGEREAAELEGPFWLQSTYVDRSDIARMFEDEGWRDWVDHAEGELPHPGLLTLSLVACWASLDNGYGFLDWEENGNPSGAEVWERFPLLDFVGAPLTADLIEADREHEELRA